MKRVLVTGATGFLGKHLVNQLISSERGVGSEKRLRVLCRGASAWDGDCGVEVAHGDVTSAADVMRAAEGVSEIYHLAGIVSRDPRDTELLRRTHVEGTRNVCEAALKHGVGKLVHVSSSGTIAVGREPVVHNEASSYKNDLVSEWPYYLTKIAAEKVALAYFEKQNLPVAVVNPSLLLGPGDDRGSSTGDVALFLQGQILALPRGGLNFVDARDAAAGVIAAMAQGKPGERYLLGGVNWTFREMIERLAGITGRRAPKLQPSLGLALLSARVLRKLLPLAGKRFALDDASIKMSALFWYCDSSKARGALGYTARDPMETLRATVDDLQRKGVAGR
ncbi:MAG TPA: NAD-dependent epimerase/dehydratase family protein [Terriglobia bacterium]|nr:NAD-dependent epimerase/dehydratase family protein [Terriglobia bacterium]